MFLIAIKWQVCEVPRVSLSCLIAIKLNITVQNSRLSWFFQIFEVRVPSAEALVPGTRVCAYWSPKYHHLYPGTVSDSVTIDPKLDSNFVNIELDDGDSRDIHFDSIRSGAWTILSSKIQA